MITGESSSESPEDSSSTTPGGSSSATPEDSSSTTPGGSSSATPEDSSSTTPGESSSTTPHTHDYVKHDAKDATCEEDGNETYYTCSDCDLIFDENKSTIEAIPTIDAGHDYVLVDGTDATCSEKGVIDHYTCDGCDKLFDLTKNEITEVEIDIDSTNHSAQTLIVAQTQPTKLGYKAGETFDPTGMVVVYKCADCEGEIVDNQFLTYTYATENATAFTLGDTKVTVTYNGLSFDVAITVSKETVEISGVEEAYETVCGVAPQINASANLADSDIVITYYDGETAIEPSTFVAGKTYTAKVAIAETETALGAEVTTTVTVKHGHVWKEDAEDWKKLTYECACGDAKVFYAMNYQAPYVDENNLAIDLSAFIHGAENVTISSVKQIVRMKDGVYLSAKEGEVVDIEYTNDGMLYSFAADKYEMPSGIWKPFILTLAVDYVIDGVECSLVVEAKLVDKLIQSADDLVSLVYTGADSTPGGGTRDTGYYVVVNDIDASALTLPAAKHAWENDLGFCGVLEGNGHTISNLNVAAWTNGLFGALGAGSKVQNLRFENVTMGEGAYLFALVMRKTNFSNVDIVFSVNTSSSLFADTINESTFADVTVKTSAGAPLCWNIDNAKAEDIPVGITVSHYDYHTVTFNTDGGNEIAPAYVTVGTTLKKPVDPEKTSELYDCVFLGWYNGETEWDFNTVLTEDITLVAKWEEISKAPEGVLLYAKTQTLTKWDYGNDITVGRTIDDTYGDVWTVTLSDIAEQSLQHPAIDTTGYEKVYFYIYNPCASVVRMVIHGGYGEGWNLAETQLVASGWTKVELDVSVFAKGDAGKIFPVLQDPAGVSIAGEWMITSFFGLKAGETAPEVEATTNVLLDAAKQTIEKSCSYGGDIVVEAATDADYGDLWKITVGDFAEQGFHHTAIDTAGFERVYFYIYNPCAYEVRLTIHGGWTDWGVATIMLPAESWTKVELNATVFTSDVAGKIFPVLQDPNAVSLAGEWKITSFYGLKTGETASEV